MEKLLTIIRRTGYCGCLPIETLASGRKWYDSFVERPKTLAEPNAAIAATSGISPEN